MLFVSKWEKNPIGENIPFRIFSPIGFWSQFSWDEKSHHSPMEYFDL